MNVRSPRVGFTLLELLVALTLAGVAVLLAHQVFTTAIGGTHSLRAARIDLDSESNARRWLASAFGSLEVGREGGVAFEGKAGAVSFSTYLISERGWFERTAVTIEADEGLLRARSGRGTVELATGVSSLALDYLLEPGANSHWVSAWSSPVSAPLAVRMRVSRQSRVDTLLFLIGPRG
jgi:prepilin-type N-terminal cleavage/methylation domain-containing protein